MIDTSMKHFLRVMKDSDIGGLKNLEKVKSKLEKIEFHYVVPYFKAILKEFCTEHYSQ